MVIDEADDSAIWAEVQSAVAEKTPPPRRIPSSTQQTPCLRNTGSFVNTTEHRKYVDDILKQELRIMYIDIPNTINAYSGDIDDLNTASDVFFRQCCSGPRPMFEEGWTS